MGDARGQGKHAGLTRKQVLAAAVRLADRDGAGALTMRKLARELDVEAMTLYHHVRNKAALEDAIVEYVATESFRVPEEPGPWDQLLADYARALDRALTAHPGAVTLFATRPALTERNLDEMEKLLGVLRDAGFAPRTALHAAYTLAGAVVAQHVAAPVKGVQVPHAEETRPLLTEALQEGPATAASRLDFTVNVLVAGLRALREQHAD